MKKQILLSLLFIASPLSTAALAPAQNSDDREKQEVCWVCKEKDFVPAQQVGAKSIPQLKTKITATGCPHAHSFHRGCFVMGALFLKGKPVCLHNNCHNPASLTLYNYPRTPADRRNDTLNFIQTNLGTGIKWGTQDHFFIMANSNKTPDKVECERLINKQKEPGFFIGLDGAYRVLKAAQKNDVMVTQIAEGIIKKDLTDKTESAPPCTHDFFESLRKNAHDAHPNQDQLSQFVTYLNEKRKQP